MKNIIYPSILGNLKILCERTVENKKKMKRKIFKYFLHHISGDVP